LTDRSAKAGTNPPHFTESFPGEGKAFRIENIRARRERPGLLRQHLTTVLAAAEAANAEVNRATLGSTTLTSSGNGTLVFQTVLPALMLASELNRIVIEEARTIWRPGLLEQMGPKVRLQFERYGFYPAGGGRFCAEVHPVRALNPFK
jgi:RNA 3'-terminal phosphate cyclase (ATP)